MLIAVAELNMPLPQTSFAMNFDDLYVARVEVRRILTSMVNNGTSIIQNIYDAFDSGFDDFLIEYGKDVDLKSVSKSLVILDKVAKRLRLVALMYPDDYEFREEQNAYNLVVRGKLNCRIKKVDQ